MVSREHYSKAPNRAHVCQYRYLETTHGDSPVRYNSSVEKLIPAEKHVRSELIDIMRVIEETTSALSAVPASRLASPGTYRRKLNHSSPALPIRLHSDRESEIGRTHRSRMTPECGRVERVLRSMCFRLVRRNNHVRVVT